MAKRSGNVSLGGLKSGHFRQRCWDSPPESAEQPQATRRSLTSLRWRHQGGTVSTMRRARRQLVGLELLLQPPELPRRELRAAQRRVVHHRRRDVGHLDEVLVAVRAALLRRPLLLQQQRLARQHLRLGQPGACVVRSHACGENGTRAEGILEPSDAARNATRGGNVTSAEGSLGPSDVVRGAAQGGQRCHCQGGHSTPF